MHQQIIWDTVKGSVCPQGAIPDWYGPYLIPLVQKNHFKYDQSSWWYKYLETHVFRCAKKKNPKSHFFILIGSNLVKMPAQTQLAVIPLP